MSMRVRPVCLHTGSQHPIEREIATVTPSPKRLFETKRPADPAVPVPLVESTLKARDAGRTVAVFRTWVSIFPLPSITGWPMDGIPLTTTKLMGGVKVNGQGRPRDRWEGRHTVKQALESSLLGLVQIVPHEAWRIRPC